MNRWTAVPVTHRKTLVPSRNSWSDSTARKPLVHTSSRSDTQDQPAIPAEAPQRDTVDNKLVSLTAVLPPPAGCEKCSLRGHRNHPRHSRRACRRSFESHCWETLDSSSQGRGCRSPAPQRSRCERACSPWACDVHAAKHETCSVAANGVHDGSQQLNRRPGT